MFKLIFVLLLLTFPLIGLTQPPTAQFTATPLTVCIGENVTFTSTSTAGSTPIVAYDWDYGDGTNPHGTNPIETHSYTSPGLKIIILNVTDQNHNTDSEVKINYINVIPNPNAQFLINANTCVLPTVATFTNQSDVGGFSYSWDFGNSQTSTLQTPPSVSYNTANTYSITLTVTNISNGCSSTVTHSISNSNFATDFTVADSACAGSLVTLIDNSVGGANSWSWLSGMAGVTSTSQNPSFTYNVAGTYNITLNSQNTISGCNSSKTKQIVIVPKPIPTFTATPISGCIPLLVTFTNTTPNSSNPTWNFGDGTPNSIGSQLTHSYVTNNFFNITLTVNGIFGCTDTKIFNNFIHTIPPNADFSGGIVKGCTPLIVQFSDFSNSSSASDPIISWAWDFGNGITSTLQSPPDQTYITGLYTVSLTITTQNGCTDTETKINYVKVGDLVSVGFTNTPPITCAKSTVTFTNTSILNGVFDPAEIIYDWDFGDGGDHGSVKDPVYSYPIDTGYFDVKLVVNYRGCKDSITINNAVFIWSAISDFTPASLVFCNPPSFPVNVAVTDKAKIGRTNDNIKIVWKWGDPLTSRTTIIGNPFNASNFSGSSNFDYNAYGSYDIEQVVYNYTTGCHDSTKQTITITKVDASFSLSAPQICKNTSVVMTGNSTTPAPGVITNYNYDMGNGLGFPFGNPTASYTYSSAGSFTITVTAMNNYFCTSTTTLPITVLELPLAQIVAPSNICGPINQEFTNNSIPQGNGSTTFSNFSWTMPRNSGIQTTNTLSQTTSFNFLVAGNFHDSISLIATDGFGCVSLPVKKYIDMTCPTSNFTIGTHVCNHFSFPTSNISTNAISYEWHLDNSTNITSTSSDLFYTFNDANIPSSKQHKVTLIAKDINGCMDSISKTIVVSIPKADFDYTFSGTNLNSDGKTATCPPIVGKYINNSSSIGNFNSSWNFDDGKTSTVLNPVNTFVFSDIYSTTLKIIDQYGCIDDTILIDILSIGGPSVTVNAHSTGTICDNLQFFDTLNPKYVDHILWDFGDGSSATTASIEHDYPVAGTYKPFLTIYDNHDCSVIYPLSSFTLPNEIKAKYVSSPSNPTIESVITFDDQSLFNASITSWYWQFKDLDSALVGVNSNILNNTDVDVTYTYKYPYTYPVTLTITDANGCVSKYTDFIHVTGDFSVPNVFTPNGDGVNDVFTFFHDLFKTYEITILNRWGNTVYQESNGKGVAIWDGTNQGNEQCVPGVYYYILKGTLTDDTPFEKVGFVTKI